MLLSTVYVTGWTYMKTTDRYLECRNVDCGQPIPLPLSNLLETPAALLESPQGIEREILVCPRCALASSYTSLDVRRLGVPGIPARGLEAAPIVAVIEFPCASTNCDSRVAVLIPTHLATNEALRAFAAKIRFSGALCPNGHPVSALPEDYWIQAAAPRSYLP
jgi:hypothetical protein